MKIDKKTIFLLLSKLSLIFFIIAVFLPFEPLISGLSLRDKFLTAVSGKNFAEQLEFPITMYLPIIITSVSLIPSIVFFILFKRLDMDSLPLHFYSLVLDICCYSYILHNYFISNSRFGIGSILVVIGLLFSGVFGILGAIKKTELNDKESNLLRLVNYAIYGIIITSFTYIYLTEFNMQFVNLLTRRIRIPNLVIIFIISFVLMLIYLVCIIRIKKLSLKQSLIISIGPALITLIPLISFLIRILRLYI